MSEFVNVGKNIFYGIVLFVTCILFLLQFAHIWFVTIKKSETCKSATKCKDITEKIDSKLNKNPKSLVARILAMPNSNKEQIKNLFSFFNVDGENELVSMLYLFFIGIYTLLYFLRVYTFISNFISNFLFFKVDDKIFENIYIGFGILLAIFLPFLLYYNKISIYKTFTTILIKPIEIINGFGKLIRRILPECLRKNIFGLSYDLYMIIAAIITFLVLYYLPRELNINENWSEDGVRKSIKNGIYVFLCIIAGITLVVVNINVIGDCIKKLIEILKEAMTKSKQKSGHKHEFKIKRLSIA